MTPRGYSGPPAKAQDKSAGAEVVVRAPAAHGDTPLLRVRNVSVSIPHRRGELLPLKQLSFDLWPGEILGFVGESGAGKSITAAAIVGLIDPPGRISSGRIWLHGERIDTNPQAIRGKRIGIIFQDPLSSLNPLRTIGDQLIETIRAHAAMSPAAARTYALQLLQEVGIAVDRFTAYPHQFSGGMRQRIVIALALAPQPDLIIADEPTTALDASVQAQVLELLQRICRQRRAAVILITHDMGVIAEITERVAVFYAGRLVESGATAAVLSDPRHPYTQGLIASTPSISESDIDTIMPQIPGAMPRLDDIPSGCAFHPRCPHCGARCRRERPGLIPAQTSRTVACWLYDAEQGR